MGLSFPLAGEEPVAAGPLLSHLHHLGKIKDRYTVHVFPTVVTVLYLTFSSSSLTLQSLSFTRPFSSSSLLLVTVLYLTLLIQQSAASRCPLPDPSHPAVCC
jgi:hypothetical protein